MITKSLPCNVSRTNQYEGKLAKQRNYKGINLRLVHTAVVKNEGGVGEYQACLLGL